MCEFYSGGPESGEFDALSKISLPFATFPRS